MSSNRGNDVLVESNHSSVLPATCRRVVYLAPLSLLSSYPCQKDQIVRMLKTCPPSPVLLANNKVLRAPDGNIGALPMGKYFSEVIRKA